MVQRRLFCGAHVLALAGLMAAGCGDTGAGTGGGGEPDASAGGSGGSAAGGTTGGSTGGSTGGATGGATGGTTGGSTGGATGGTTGGATGGADAGGGFGGKPNDAGPRADGAVATPDAALTADAAATPDAASAPDAAGPCVPAPETCNGLDDDCDQAVDEGDLPGEPLAEGCYEGPPGTEGVASCHGGTSLCLGGAWQPCMGQALPGVEICDGEDNDCDGGVDDGDLPAGACGCLPGAAQICYSGPEGTEGVGRCLAGVQFCNPDGQGFGPCNNQVLPADEICDGLDDDCDGVADDDIMGAGLPCSDGIGACMGSGTTVCDAFLGEVVCDAERRQPSVELCNGLDDDCNGRTDEGYDLGAACSIGVGACASTGALVCDPATGGVMCDAVPRPDAIERCNGADDDCDGQIDEGFDVGGGCTVGVGVCLGRGERVCDPATGAAVCDAIAAPPAMERCDGLDNDCNGLVDDGFGLGSACALGQGACLAAGALVCDALSGDAICNAQPGVPAMERCDGQDNDCDGETDEDFGLGAACSVGIGACAANGATACNGAGNGVVCNAQPGAPSPELCDRLDNDCDGQIDDCGPGLACQGGPTCKPVCAIGRADCDGNELNLCEVDTQTDPQHCGLCGHPCGAGEACVGGVCQVACGNAIVDSPLMLCVPAGQRYALSGDHCYQDVIIRGTLAVPPGGAGEVTLRAVNLTVDAGGVIDGDAAGRAGGLPAVQNGGLQGAGPAPGCGGGPGGCVAQGGTGASYGGAGNTPSPNQFGGACERCDNPTSSHCVGAASGVVGTLGGSDLEPGSGGGAAGNSCGCANSGARGGAGGAAIRLLSRNARIDGTVRARGEQPPPDAANCGYKPGGGGGAGGGILVRADALAGAGSLLVDGGAGGDTPGDANDWGWAGGGGGGGRVKIFTPNGGGAGLSTSVTPGRAGASTCSGNYCFQGLPGSPGTVSRAAIPGDLQALLCNGL
jgi:hypothetical protein